MSYKQGFFLYLAAFFLQPFLFELIPGFGGNVNLILCLTVMLTYLFDETLPGLFFGFIFGLLSDSFYGMYIGAGTFALVVVGVTVFVLKEFTNIENFFNTILVMAASTWMYTSIYWLIYHVIGSPYSYFYAMKSIPLMLLFNCVIAAGLYMIFIKRVIKYRRDRYFR